MTTSESGRLKRRLREVGLSNAAINAVWPRWWSEDAQTSPSARAELRFSVARRFGLDPRSLMEDADQPRFMWQAEARFKHLSGETELEQAGLTSFGRSVAATLLAAAPTPTADIRGTEAGALRNAVLASNRPYVELTDLLSVAWSVGIPAVHLRVYPLPQKRMAAMTVSVSEQPAVLLGKDSSYPAQIAFYLAHEIGHIALRHLASDRLIVDFEEAQPAISADDQEERAADEYALELLTGRPQPTVVGAGPYRPSARSLAQVAVNAGSGLRIEPGMLAQCYGYSTQDWAVATKSLRYIYPDAQPVWRQVNAIARAQLELDGLPQDSVDFLDAVLGSTEPSTG
jgi:hypothetical protein